MDTDSKLLALLRELGHMGRFGFGGKDSQNRILCILADTETMEQRELTERLGIQSGSASEVISKLERAGLIIRTPSEEDRRTVTITLTEEGRTQAADAAAQREAQKHSMLAALTEEEKNTFLSLMEKLSQSWMKPAPETQE